MPGARFFFDGPAWQIEDEFTELHEDPDLDRYLADPTGFVHAKPV
jgi:hypothetical protein